VTQPQLENSLYVPQTGYIEYLLVAILLAIIDGYYTVVLGAKEQKICTEYVFSLIC
jgi:hypothetical protein